MLKYDNQTQFKIERGFLNRTRIYLYPAIVLMKSYRPYIGSLRENFLCTSYENESIIVYYDRGNTVGIKKLIDVLKENKEYLDSWMPNENTYAIRLKPDLNYSAFEEGSYSKIYKREYLSKVFSPDSKTKQVLSKNKLYKQEFVDQLNTWFGVNHTIESLEKRPDGIHEIQEYDIPPCMNQEILNYEKELKIRGKISEYV